MSDKPISPPFRLQVLYVVGLSVTLLAVGALLAETLFVFIASVIGITVLQGAVTWIVIGVLTLALAVFAIRSGVGE